MRIASPNAQQGPRRSSSGRSRWLAFSSDELKDLLLRCALRIVDAYLSESPTGPRPLTPRPGTVMY